MKFNKNICSMNYLKTCAVNIGNSIKYTINITMYTSLFYYIINSQENILAVQGILIKNLQLNMTQFLAQKKVETRAYKGGQFLFRMYIRRSSKSVMWDFIYVFLYSLDMITTTQIQNPISIEFLDTLKIGESIVKNLNFEQLKVNLLSISQKVFNNIDHFFYNLLYNIL